MCLAYFLCSSPAPCVALRTGLTNYYRSRTLVDRAAYARALRPIQTAECREEGLECRSCVQSTLGTTDVELKAAADNWQKEHKAKEEERSQRYRPGRQGRT